MLDISLTPINESDIQRQLSVLAPRAIKRAEVSGLNRSLRSARASLSRTVRRDLALKSKTVKDATKTKRATWSQRVPEASITVDRKPMPLKEYGAKQIKSGLSARIMKKKGRSRVRSGFIIGSYGGNAYLRTSKSRGPLRALFGPSVGGAANQRSDEILSDIEIIVDKQIRGRVAWEIEKLLR